MVVSDTACRLRRCLLCLRPSVWRSRRGCAPARGAARAPPPREWRCRRRARARRCWARARDRWVTRAALNDANVTQAHAHGMNTGPMTLVATTRQMGHSGIAAVPLALRRSAAVCCSSAQRAFLADQPAACVLTWQRGTAGRALRTRAACASAPPPSTAAVLPRQCCTGRQRWRLRTASRCALLLFSLRSRQRRRSSSWSSRRG